MSKFIEQLRESPRFLSVNLIQSLDFAIRLNAAYFFYYAVTYFYYFDPLFTSNGLMEDNFFGAKDPSLQRAIGLFFVFLQSVSSFILLFKPRSTKALAGLVLALIGVEILIWSGVLQIFTAIKMLLGLYFFVKFKNRLYHSSKKLITVFIYLNYLVLHFSSGVAKVLNADPLWRKGDAVANILLYSSWTRPLAAELAQNMPTWSLTALTYSVLAVELLSGFFFDLKVSTYFIYIFVLMHVTVLIFFDIPQVSLGCAFLGLLAAAVHREVSKTQGTPHVV